MKKQVKDLIPGDAFKDSLGLILKVEKIEFLPWNQIPRTKPQVRVTFDTGRNRMFMNFASDRIVEVV